MVDSENWRLEAIRTAIEECRRIGSPVASGDLDRTAQLALRRLKSFERRAKKSHGRLARIEDLNKGLIQSLARDPKLVGPLEKDYRFLAESIYESWAEAPWIRACALHPIGEHRTVHTATVESFGLLVHMADTEVHGLLVWPNIPPEEQTALRAGTPGEQIDAVVSAHPDHHQQIWLTRVGVQISPAYDMKTLVRRSP